MKSFLMYCLAALLGAVFYSGLTEAHPPCDANPPQCRYVQVVNPITGQLEQQYVCH
ncbi:hypothetical protein LCGC14_1909200 [marine sediment metagenome]|uniref:Uncharacterized protein n=1 Tax=marine sediment metagenome TaxID=412755 RepID=A0A0F9FU71_9ZZZZ